LNYRPQLLGFERPDQSLFRPEPDGFISLSVIPGMANSHYRYIRTKAAEPAQKVQSVGISRGNIQQKQAGCGAGLHTLHGMPAVSGRFCPPGVGFLQGAEEVEQRGLPANH
jgi:hypothetical protein